MTDPMTVGIPTIQTPPPTTVAVPPTIVAEKSILADHGRRRHLVGFELDFSRAMDPARAANAVNDTLAQSGRGRRQLVVQPVAFRATYDAAAHTGTLILAVRPKFTKGGMLVVVARPPGGVVDAAGVPLDGGGLGTFGDDAIFVIAPKGTGISRRAGSDLGR